MTAPRPDQALAELLTAMAEAGVDTALMGGYAVTTWGVPRATYDIDVLVDVDEQGLTVMFAKLEQHGFGIDAIYRTGWRDRIRDMPLIKAQVFREGRSITNDLFPVTTPLQQSAFRRAKVIRVPLAGRDTSVISAADLILFKLLADRPKDRIDVQNVLAVQGLPEASYVRDWAARLGVTDRLGRALAEAGL